MDLDKKKKIAIIASIIAGSVIILVICIWVLIASLQKDQRINTQTQSPATTGESQVPTETAGQTTGGETTDTSDVTPAQTTAPASTTAPVVTTQKPTPTENKNMPKISTAVKKTQTFYDSNAKRSNLEISFEIDKPGKVYLIAVNSAATSNFTSDQVKNLAIFGGNSLPNDDARYLKQVNANDKDNNVFPLTVGTEKVDIYIVLESSNGESLTSPIRINYTPAVAPSLTNGNAGVEIKDNKIIITSQLTEDGYVHALVMNNSSPVLNNAKELISRAKKPGDFDDILLNNKNSTKYAANTDFELSVNILSGIQLDQLKDCSLVLIYESADSVYNLKYKTIPLNDKIPLDTGNPGDSSNPS